MVFKHDSCGEELKFATDQNWRIAVSRRKNISLRLWTTDATDHAGIDANPADLNAWEIIRRGIAAYTITDRISTDIVTADRAIGTAAIMHKSKCFSAVDTQEHGQSTSAGSATARPARSQAIHTLPSSKSSGHE